MGFRKGFQLFDDTVGIFGIVLSHPSFDTGSIKQKHGSFIGVNLLATGSVKSTRWPNMDRKIQ